MTTPDELYDAPAESNPAATSPPAGTLTPDLFRKPLAAPAKVVGVILPTVGVSVYVKRLAEDERKALAATAADKKDPDTHRGRVLAATMCYADGSQGFDAASIEVIQRATRQELDSAYAQACHLNGVSFLRNPARPAA